MDDLGGSVFGTVANPAVENLGWGEIYKKSGYRTPSVGGNRSFCHPGKKITLSVGLQEMTHVSFPATISTPSANTPLSTGLKNAPVGQRRETLRLRFKLRVESSSERARRARNFTAQGNRISRT